jgi:hypothetical protein
MVHRLRTLLAALALSAAACGGSEPAAPLAVGTQPLAGKVGGQPWTFAHGSTNAFLSGSRPDFFGELYADGTPGCGTFSTSNRVILAIPKAPGDYPFTTQRNGTFVVGGSSNLVAMQGRIIVEQVTTDAVTARVHMVFDGSNEIDGEFVASICP